MQQIQSIHHWKSPIFIISEEKSHIFKGAKHCNCLCSPSPVTEKQNLQKALSCKHSEVQFFLEGIKNTFHFCYFLKILPALLWCQCHLGVFKFVFIDQTRISSKQKKSSSNERQHWSDEYCILSIPKICFFCLIWLFNSSCFFVTKQPLRTFFLLLVSAGLRRQNFWHQIDEYE